MMVIFVCLVFLFNVFASNGDNIGENPVKEDYWHGFPYDEYKAPYSSDHKDHDPIIRPCSVHDEDCIRRVFTSTFNCLATHGPVPDPYTADTLDMDIPNSNLTFTINDAKIKGLSSGKIREFYINKKTDRVVLEVVFDSVIVFSPRSVISYHRQGKEPVETSDFSIIEFKSLSLTLTISNVGQKSWKAHVYTYLTDADMPYKFGPELTEGKDPLVKRNSKKLMDEMILSVKEAFLTQGPLFLSVYLQSNICDFRLH